MKTQRTEQEIKAHLAFAKRYRDQLANEIVQLEAQLKSRQPKPIKITHHVELEVKPTDEPELMTWCEAMDKFGPDGTDKEWRLPTRSELSVMCRYKDKIPGLQDCYYWSSTVNNEYLAWAQRFTDGNVALTLNSYTCPVRCVRR